MDREQCCHSLVAGGLNHQDATARAPAGLPRPSPVPCSSFSFPCLSVTFSLTHRNAMESCPCRRHTQIHIGISPEPTTHTPDPLLSIQSISGSPEGQAPPGWIGSSAAVRSSPAASTTRTPLPEHQQDRRVPPLFPARPSPFPASPSHFLSLTGTPWSALALELQRDPCPWVPCFDHLLEPDHARPQAPATGTHAGSRSSHVSGKSVTTRDIHGCPLVLRIAPDHHPQCRRAPVASPSPVRDHVCLPCLTPCRREFSPSPTSIGHSPATPSPHGPRPHHPKPDLAERSSIASLTFGLAGSATPAWTLPLPGPAACRPLLGRVRCYRCFPIERASTNPSAKSTAIPCVLTTPLDRPCAWAMRAPRPSNIFSSPEPAQPLLHFRPNGPIVCFSGLVPVTSRL
ncbi:proline-rich protein 33 [Triticum aestivum]|uniref:proline-rich protein 33 n=1 Tax=Triticum aestivum TaxID=4565 RepID=UPI001D02B523|nr:proline-rich protein 33-like [Triticum aestivum]